MSVEQARKWLEEHPQNIPCLAVNKQQIDEIIDHEQLSHELVQIAVHDPGIILSLLSQVNSRRGPKSGRDIVESPQAAVALLGDKVSHNLFKNSPVAEKQLDNPEQTFLFQQIINRSYHNETQAGLWAQENGYKQIDQIKVMAILAYSGEILSCLYDFDTYLQYLNQGATQQAQLDTFGFSFSKLSEELYHSLNLPDLLIRSLPHLNDKDSRAQLLSYTSQICSESESGWYSSAMQNIFNDFSSFLNLPVEKVIEKTHQFSISAARQSVVKTAWQPAARLILTQDQHWRPAYLQQADSQPPEVSDDAAIHQQGDAFEQIKQMVKKPEASQSDILNICLKGLFDEVKLSKVSLMLLSQDKSLLQNRMAIGIDNDSPLRSYKIETEKSGLLKLLMKKPQAIWINSDSFKKYQNLLPQSLLASIMTNNFLAMSLFIGQQPIGLLYADRTDSTTALDQDTFTQFKQLASLTSKALTLLSKR